MNNTSDMKTILAVRILVAQTWLKNVWAFRKSWGVEHLFGQVERIEDLGATKIITDGNLKAKPWWLQRV